MPLRRSLRHRELTIAATASLLVCWQAGARAQSDGFPLPLAFPHQPPAKPVSPPQRTGPEVPAPAAPGTRYEPQSQVQTKPMRVEVIDGNRFRDIESGAVYRLWGVDVCAPDQTALLGRQPWPCGTMARAWLVNETLGKWVSCVLLDKQGDELAVRCSSSTHQDVALAMLKEGVAVALPPEREPKQVKVYLAAQEAARKAFRGLWGSAFDMPWAYRSQLAAAELKAESPPPPAPDPVNPTEGPTPSGITGDQPIQNENGPPKSPGLVRGRPNAERR
jgi:endonuclease YncB( thermonuclease family)